MSYEEFNALMSGFESLFVIGAIVAGGIWAWRKFTALVEKDRAQADLSRIQIEIQQMELARRKAQVELDRLEQIVGAQAVIEMSINTSQLSLEDDTSPYVSAVVEISNKGTRNTRLKFADDRQPFAVWAVEKGGDGEFEFVEVSRHSTPVATSPNEKSPSSIVRAGGLERIPFVFRVPSPGLYLLIFSVPVLQEEKEIADKLGFQYGANWAAKKFIVVQ